MPRQDYEERQERRRERLEERAEKQHAEAGHRHGESQRMAETMNGQPVLIGHHSEKRHRRDIDRMWNHTRKGLEADQAARDLDHRAEAVGTGGVSSDDPEAVTKLKTKLAGLESGRDKMKAINAAWRKAGKPRADNAEGWAKVAEILGHNVEQVRIDQARDFTHRAPFTYAITNQGAEIRRISQRIEALARAEAAPDHPAIEGEGWRIWEDRDENRLFICHDAKPAGEVRDNLKRWGFRWNRYAGAWGRLLNATAWRNAEYLATEGLLD